MIGKFLKVIFAGIVVSLVVLATQPSAYAQINIGSGDFTATTVCPSGSIVTGCQVATNNNAANGSGALQLTQSQSNQTGSAWAVFPQSVLNGFSTTFVFQVTNASSPAPGDGIAFVIQNSPAGVAAIGNTAGSGGAIGYGEDDNNYYPTTAIQNSLAIELDTVDNGWDPNGNHVAVQSCGTGYITSHHNQVCYNQTVSSTLGINPVLPITIADGGMHTVNIQYNPPGTPCYTSGTGNLCVYLDPATNPAPVLDITADISTIGLGNNGTAYVGFTSGTGEYFATQSILSWSFNGVITQPITVNPTGPGPTLTAAFSTPATGGTVTTVTDFSTAGNGMGLPQGITNPILTTINNTVTPTTWPEYVVGTPWATSSCTAKVGNGGSGNLCSQYINQCFDASAGASTASDANCPTVNDPGFQNYVTLEDTFDWGTGGKQTIAPGTTASLIAFSVPTSNPGLQWNASLPPATTNPVCASIPGTASPSCYLSDSLVDVYGDQTTTRGSKPKSKAWLVSVYNVPMLFTNIFAEPNPGSACPLKSAVQLNNTSSPVWVNGACLFDFQVNPAVPPGGATNNFQAAPPASLLYGPGAPVIAPGPIPTGDTLVSNPNPNCTGTVNCAPALWDTQTGSNATAVITGTIPVSTPPLSSLGNNGTFTLHWSAIDLAGITEKSIVLSTAVGGQCTLPDGSTVSGSQCYNTSYFTTQVNIDSTAPSITGYSFIPVGSPAGIFGLNQTVYPTYSCTDNLSGLSSCGGVPVSGCPLTANVTSSTQISTSTPGAHSYSVTATDCASNISAATVVSYTVASSADVAIIGGATSNTSKSITYVAAALDLTQGTSAYGVVITFQITDPKASVSGPITGVFADVSCSLLGCSELPSGPIACSTNGDTVSCNVGTLPSIFQLKGAVAQITIPVVAKPQSGATIGITATVSSDDDPNPKNNTTSVTVSVK